MVRVWCRGQMHQRLRSVPQADLEVYQQETPNRVFKNARPKTLRFPNGSLLTLREYDSPMLDIYCYMKGYYDMDREKLVNDFDYLEKISEAQCASAGWQNSELSLQDVHDLYLRETEILALLMAEKGISDVNQSLVDTLEAHFVVKCLLGRGRGAICDVPECSWRTCVTRGSRFDGTKEVTETIVKYTSLNECPKL